MPTFLKVRRNQLIIGGFLVVLLLLLAFLVLAPRKQDSSLTSSSGSSTVTPSPSPDVSPSPSPSPSVTPSAAATPPSGAFLLAGHWTDEPANGFGNGGAGCHPSTPSTPGLDWHHAGWSQDDCGIALIGSDAEHSLAWITEHRSSPPGRRVSILKTGGSGSWVTVMYRVDEGGGSFTAVSVRSGDITADGQPELLVGFRMVGTNHVLNLDGVRRTGLADPLVVIHRELVNGRAVMGSGNGFTDYSAMGSAYSKTQVTYAGGSFHLSSTTVPSAPAGDFS